MQRVAVEIHGIDHAVKDVQTVDPDGREIGSGIEGVEVRPAVTHADELGTVCEIWDERWDFAAGAVPFIYTITIRPGRVKGWIVHELPGRPAVLRLRKRQGRAVRRPRGVADLWDGGRPPPRREPAGDHPDSRRRLPCPAESRHR